MVSFGYLTWASFLYIWVRTKHRPWLLAAAMYAAGTIFVIATFSTAPEDLSRRIDALAMTIIILMWIGGFVHALAVNPGYLRMLRSAGK